jgi:hypothetical protein
LGFGSAGLKGGRIHDLGICRRRHEPEAPGHMQDLDNLALGKPEKTR